MPSRVRLAGEDLEGFIGLFMFDEPARDFFDQVFVSRIHERGLIIFLESGFRLAILVENDSGGVMSVSFGQAHLLAKDHRHQQVEGPGEDVEVEIELGRSHPARA